VARGPRPRRGAVPPPGLTGPPEGAQRRAPSVPRRVPRTVGALCQALVVRADNAPRPCPPDRAAADVGCAGFPRPLPPQAQRLCGHRALPAQDAAVVQRAWRRDALVIQEPGRRQGPERDQMGPVPGGPRPACRCPRDDAPDTPRTHGSQARPHARALLEPCTPTASVGIDHDSLPEAPGPGPVREGRGAPWAFLVGTAVMVAGRADSHVSGTVPRRRTPVLTHGEAPRAVCRAPGPCAAGP
jgi:hypothetical protein